MVEATTKERRAESRRGGDFSAIVILSTGERKRAKVVDFSSAGCKLQLEQGGELPERFDLELGDATYRCEQRWAKTPNIGVQFVATLSKAAPKAAVA